MLENPSDTPTAVTRLEVPAPRASLAGAPISGSASGGAGEGAALTPEAAIQRDEIGRLRLFVSFVILLCVVVIPGLWLLGGDRLARQVMLGGALAAIASSTAISLILRRRPDLLPVCHFAFGMICVLVMTCAFFYFGALSPALVVVTFGAFIFAVGQSFKGAATITASLIVIHLGLSLSNIFGALAERGLFRPVGVGVAGQLTALALVHVIFIGTFVMSRQIRANALKNLEDLHAAARAVAQREMLLAEARQDLFAALQVGGPGRYSDQTLGRWRLGVLLGRGGMGEIYAATDSEGGAGGGAYAVKLLYPHLVHEAAHFERFRREAELSMQLRSPHVVRVIEVSPPEATPPYLVMERLEGWDLGTRLKQRPRLPGAEVVEMLRQVALGLGEAHAAGIVHRDLKPQNLFCAGADAAGHKAGRWKILDFGASTLRSSHGTLTAGAVIGTPPYMAPEQARGETVDGRADVYALAVIAYRALTGTPAFPQVDLPAVLFAVQHKLPPRPSELAALPPQLDDVLLVGMAKDRDHRFATATELAAAVAEALEGRIDGDLRARAWTLSERWPWGASAA